MPPAGQGPRAIPILNVYYLLCYAWDHVQQHDTARLKVQPHHTAQDLLGKVLAGGVNHLMRRGLDRGYLERCEDLAGIRGKLAVSETAKRALKAQARAACQFEELSPDILRNRILQASLRRLLRASQNGIDLSSDVRREVRSAYRKMPAVSPLRLARSHFTRVQLAGGNRKLYRFLLSVCRLIHESMLVDEQTGASRFQDFVRNKTTMWRLFEDFAAGFYRREQREFRVGAQSQLVFFGVAGAGKADLSLIPVMRPDLILETKNGPNARGRRPASPGRRSAGPAIPCGGPNGPNAHGRRIIIDTKFYRTVLPRGRLDSGNLYQLLAYLRNRQAQHPDGPRHEGILLYAQSGAPVKADVCLEGFRIQARTVNLNQHWQEIHNEMLAVLDLPPSPSVASSQSRAA